MIGRRVAVTGLLGASLAGCGSSTSASTGGIPPGLLAQARPIGAGPRFHPGLGAGARIVGGCRPALGRRFGVHVEIFAANRVVLLSVGIGVRAPHVDAGGRVSRARCYGALVTLDPTGLVLVRPGSRLHLADLFGAWGRTLSSTRIASFRASAGGHTSVYVDGRPFPGPPGAVALSRHREIVLEIGPHVPPHHAYRFPPGS